MHMHVFPFSPREGTAAARWTDHFVPDAVSKARVRHLIALEDDPIDGRRCSGDADSSVEHSGSSSNNRNPTPPAS